MKDYRKDSARPTKSEKNVENLLDELCSQNKSKTDRRRRSTEQLQFFGEINKKFQMSSNSSRSKDDSARAQIVYIRTRFQMISTMFLDNSSVR